MSAPSTPCTYKSVTLAPGEQFNLPPNSTIIGSSNISAISSTCPLPTTLENYECYILVMVALPDQADATLVWEGGTADLNAYLFDISVGGTVYPISPALGADGGGIFNVAGLASFINSNSSISGALLNVSYNSNYDYPRGGVATLCFQAIPSIGENVYVSLSTFVQGLGTPSPQTVVRVYAKKLSDYIAGGTPSGTCGCPAQPSN